MTPDSASLQTLQYVGLAWEQAYQLCIPEKWSMLYWVVCGKKRRRQRDETGWR